MAKTPSYDIYQYAEGANVLKFSGPLTDCYFPIAYIAEMTNAHEYMEVGDRLKLDRWHYAERTA